MPRHRSRNVIPRLKKSNPVLRKGFRTKHGIRHGDVASNRSLTVSQEYLKGLNIR